MHLTTKAKAKSRANEEEMDGRKGRAKAKAFRDSALHAEKNVRTFLADGSAPGANGTARYVNLLDLLDNRRALDRELVRTIESSRDASRTARSFSLACDKANVCGIPLHNGIIGMGANVLSMAVPQVLDG